MNIQRNKIEKFGKILQRETRVVFKNINKYKTIKNIILGIILFNIYLMYHTVLGKNGIIVYSTIKKEQDNYNSIFAKNEKKIENENEKIDLKFKNEESKDQIEEIIKRNSNYGRMNEKVIILDKSIS